MLDWTPTPISTRRAGRLLWLGVSTVVLVTALAGPAISAPRSPAGPNIAGDKAGRSSQWTARPPLRQARGGLGVAKVGRQILAIGGFKEVNDMFTLFDVVEARRVRGSGRWRDLAPMPTARANLATAEVGGLVYAIGGLDALNTLDVVERFNPRSGRWTTSVPLPQPRARPGAAGLGGLLYVAGGEVQLAADTFEVLNSVLVYDPKQNTWRSVAPMPTARTGLRLVASGRYLYAIGGAAPPSGADPSEIGPSLSTVERYDPKSDRWTTMNPLVESRGLPCAVETKVGKRRVLVVVGGFEVSADGTLIQARRTTEVFDPATGRWTLLDVLLPIGRGSHDCATEADGTVLAIGGITHVGDTRVFLANVDALSLKRRDLRSH
jgi:N-acetylneuraminic acid mutarotase